MLDKARLAKILALTTSDNDGEALSAIRRANAAIKAEGLQWSDLITAAVTTGMTVAPAAGEDWVPPHLKDASVIELMFRTVFAQPRSSNEEFWKFMESIHGRWTKHGALSQGQYQALRNCYNRAMKRA